MDASPPFTADAERLRLLYRLPLSGGVQRILVMGSQVDALRLVGRESHEVQVEIGGATAQTGGAPFDVVMLPLSMLGDGDGGCGSPPRASFPDLVRRAYDALRPGGILVGHTDNILSLATVRSVLRGQASLRAWSAWRGAWSTRACLSTLERAGLEAAECYFVEPRIGAPMSLVPLASRPARSHFVRAVRRTRASYSIAGYLLRLTVAAAGFGGSLQPHLFYWARRPC